MLRAEQAGEHDRPPLGAVHNARYPRRHANVQTCYADEHGRKVLAAAKLQPEHCSSSSTGTYVLWLHLYASPVAAVAKGKRDTRIHTHTHIYACVCVLFLPGIVQQYPSTYGLNLHPTRRDIPVYASYEYSW